MSKILALPASRLVCFGGARRHTNSPIGFKDPEVELPERWV